MTESAAPWLRWSSSFRHRIVVVLGSGHVRDMPLDLLRKRFARVLLVDAVHLPQVRVRMLAHRNVAPLTPDLSGVMGWLAGTGTDRADPVADLIADPAIDLVTSANLLSQLAWPVEDWRDARPTKARTLPADLPRRCIAWHLEDLKRFKGRVCLLSDVGAIKDTSVALAAYSGTENERLTCPSAKLDSIEATLSSRVSLSLRKRS